MIPVGLDALRLWERWPYLRIGARTYMRSTYDRAGGNEAADASHFLYQVADDFNVALDVAGPGVLYFARYNHWHGSPWHYVVDDTDYVVQETSSADPDHPVPNSVFEPEYAFPNPLAWTWSDTRGADLSWVPIPFERSFQMAYSRTHYGTGYYIYQTYVPGARLSQRIQAFTEQAPNEDVRDLLLRAGRDIAPQPGQGEVVERHGQINVPGNGSVTLTDIADAPSMLRALELSVPVEEAVAFSRARLRITWDGRPEASIDAPVALFFGAGTLYNRDGREFLVKAFPVNIRYDTDRVHLACYFPMPFFRSAHIELAPPPETERSPSSAPVRFSDIRWSVRYVPLDARHDEVAYFHATYRDHPDPEPGRDLILLDTRGTERAPEWSGHLVGTSFIFSHRADLRTLEGDPRFFLDDSLTPQVQGTGTEEWSGGGDYWGGRNMTLAFVGHPTGAPSASQAQNDEDLIESAYRFLLSDLMPFGRNAVIGLEHGGVDESTEHYETVAFWYGIPRPTLMQTDELKVGDEDSEAAHDYASPDASEPLEIISRYEWGIDHLNGNEVFPAESDWGRVTTGTSEFTLSVRPDNWGVLLRRKLDYSYPNQRADVFVADVGKRNWRRAGVWFLAGSNTIVYSNPRGELGETQHIVKTSNRRFRDDEFLIGRNLTRGRSAIRVRIRFTPVDDKPLYPGCPLPDLGWSEMRYTAYSFVSPQ